MSFEAAFVHDAEVIDYTPVSAVAAGDVIEVGSIPFVATHDIAAAALGALATTGAFDVNKDASTFTAGDAVYWDKPVLESCPQCDSKFLVEKTTKRHGTVRSCPNEECGYKSEPLPLPPPAETTNEKRVTG